MISTETYFQSLVTAMYIMACLMVAAIRWFHMCRPYDRNPLYYYPGRKATTILYLTSLALLPTLIFPDTLGAWLLVKAYFLPMSLYSLTILLFSYFGGVMHWRKWRRPTLTLGGVALLAIIIGPLASLLTGKGFNGELVGNIIILTLGLFMTVASIIAVKMVLRWTRKYDVEEYSNPDDFPVNFARKMIRIAMVTVAILWIAALSDSRIVMAIVQLLMIVVSVLMLISALHPQRKAAPEAENQENEKNSAGETAEKVYSYKISPAKAKAIAAAIRREVEEEQAFLDPHLTLQDVSLRCGYNRTYVAGIFKTEFGGFFRYVNTLRLNYADEYRAAHPKATIAEIADASGFGSRQSYYSVKETIRP